MFITSRGSRNRATTERKWHNLMRREKLAQINAFHFSWAPNLCDAATEASRREIDCRKFAICSLIKCSRNLKLKTYIYYLERGAFRSHPFGRGALCAVFVGQSRCDAHMQREREELPSVGVFWFVGFDFRPKVYPGANEKCTSETFKSLALHEMRRRRQRQQKKGSDNDKHVKFYNENPLNSLSSRSRSFPSLGKSRFLFIGCEQLFPYGRRNAHTMTRNILYLVGLAEIFANTKQ